MDAMTLVGICAGSFIHGVFAALGLSTIIAHAPPLFEALLLLSVLNLVALVIKGTMAFAAGQVRDLLRRRTSFARWMNRTLAIVFAGLALRLLATRRPDG